MNYLKKLFLITAFTLTFCGCTTEKESKDTEEDMVVYSTELNDRQKEILAEMDLPQEYDQLLDSQKNAITVIELALEYAEKTYGGEFKYITYYSADLMDGSPQTVVMYQVGDEQKREISVGVKFKDGKEIYTDDYKEIYAVEEYTAAISDYISKQLPGAEFKIYDMEIDDYRDGDEPIVQRCSSGANIVIPDIFKNTDEATAFMNNFSQWLSNNKKEYYYRLVIFSQNDYDEINEKNLDEYRRQKGKAIYEITADISSDGRINIHLYED